MSDHERDDRILPATRRLALVIFPVLVVAFCVLYPVPTDTKDLFAWQIKPTMTPMVLGSAYLGGAYFFFEAWRAEQWHTVKVGFVPVTLFASLLGIATVVHWDKFNHDHVAFWLWSGLYFTTPFLVLAVFVQNRRHEAAPDPDDPLLPTLARTVAGLAGIAALGLGAWVYLFPTAAIDAWPWTISPLTGRVVGSVLMLGVAGIYVAIDPRWSVARLIVRVEQIMVGLILLAAVRARDQFDTSRPLTWMLGTGLLFVLAGSVWLERSMQQQLAGPVVERPVLGAS